MAPKFLGAEVPDVAGKDRRAVLAEWLASPKNPYFARNLVNLVWAHFLGRGIIEPVDDVRISNPAVNPELLDELAKRFTEYNYDFKRLIRDICTSRTYQLSSKANDTNSEDTRNFSKSTLRRQRAEVMLLRLARSQQQIQEGRRGGQDRDPVQGERPGNGRGGAILRDDEQGA